MSLQTTSSICVFTGINMLQRHPQRLKEAVFCQEYFSTVTKRWSSGAYTLLQIHFDKDVLHVFPSKRASGENCRSFARQPQICALSETTAGLLTLLSRVAVLRFQPSLEKSSCAHALGLLQQQRSTGSRKSSSTAAFQ